MKVVGEKEKASSELIFGAFYPCENSVQPSLRQQLSTLEKYRTIFARHDDCNPRQNCPIYSYKYMPRCHIQTLFMLMLYNKIYQNYHFLFNKNSFVNYLESIQRLSFRLLIHNCPVYFYKYCHVVIFNPPSF